MSFVWGSCNLKLHLKLCRVQGTPRKSSPPQELSHHRSHRPTCPPPSSGAHNTTGFFSVVFIEPLCQLLQICHERTFPRETGGCHHSEKRHIQPVPSFALVACDFATVPKTSGPATAPNSICVFNCDGYKSRSWTFKKITVSQRASRCSCFHYCLIT